MKNVKNVMLFLITTFCFVMMLDVTKVAGANSQIPYSIDYTNEWIKCDRKVYYQVTKQKQESGFEPTKWIPAVVGDTGFFIDFSNTAETKTIYYALTTDATSTVAETIVSLDVVVKSVKVKLNYYADANPQSIDSILDVLREITVKGVEKKDDYVGGAYEYSFQWRRGKNHKWSEANEFTKFTWELLKSTQGTLYLRMNGKLDKDTKEYVAFRPSKEVKVKIPKVPKAPNITIDYKKGTIGIKNGMEFTVYVYLPNESGGTWSGWVSEIVPHYENEAVSEFKWFATSDSAYYPTNTKVSKLNVLELVNEYNQVLKKNTYFAQRVLDPSKMILRVRKIASDKALPSAWCEINLSLPQAAPSVVKDCKIQQLFIDFRDVFADTTQVVYSEYEYVLAGKGSLDIDKQTWKKVPETGILDLSKKLGKTYEYWTEGKKETIKYEDTTVLYIRKIANKAEKRFASMYAAIPVEISEQTVE